MFETEAKRLCDAIKELAANEYAIDNFESYLTTHLDTWYKKFASSADDLTTEFEFFASLYEEG